MLGLAVGIFTKPGLVDAVTTNVNLANDYLIARLYGDHYAKPSKIRKWSSREPKCNHREEDNKTCNSL